MMLGNSTGQTEVADLSSHEKLILYPIVILVFVIGIHPDPLLQISEAAVEDLLKIFSTNSAILK
jgi:NADH:ubiquinone oxidoreductase subunit 4 (subunit M)